MVYISWLEQNEVSPLAALSAGMRGPFFLPRKLYQGI